MGVGVYREEVKSIGGFGSAVSCWECLCGRRQCINCIMCEFCVAVCVCVLTRRAREYKGSTVDVVTLLYCISLCVCVCPHCCGQ